MSEQLSPEIMEQLKRQKMRDRLERIATSVLGGMMSNPAWNSPASQKYLAAKDLTLEKLASHSALELTVEIDALILQIENANNQPTKPTLVTE